MPANFAGVVFLTKCQTSSISTTAVPPRAGSGLGQWACA